MFRTYVPLLLALAPFCHAGVAAAAPAADRVAAAARLEQALIAPCCFHQTVAEHRSPESDAVREDVRRRLEAGESEASILAFYEQRYGERILAAPHLSGFGLLAWLTPGVVLLGAAGLVWRWLRHHRRREQPRAGGVPIAPADGAVDARLAAELARLDV
jgi:cytochrome c-type biogenesis protein CcmH